MILEMALRAAGETATAVVSWGTCTLYFLAAQVVTVISVVEIGPNFLAAVTSIIGAVVLLGQAYLARRVRNIDAKADDAHTTAQQNRHRLDAVENGDD